MAKETDPQAAVVAFLSDPASYGPGLARIDIIETHISRVFLAGDRAYKLKRAVRLPYLDFSTEKQRRLACEAELSLNRRTAPDLYLDVRAVSVRPDGNIGWGEAGRIVDWVVVMQRFDQDALFDSLADRGMLGPALMREVTDHIVGFHAKAERLFGCGGSEAIARVEQTNLTCLKQHAERIFPPDEIEELHARSLASLSSVAGLLDARRTAGKVRRCHGDLHLRNILLRDGKPVLFDCIEFSDELANTDTLYDFAFLLMDLEHRGLHDLANRGFNRYLDLTDDDEGLAALPLFISLRAAVRAHVLATTAYCGEAKPAFRNAAEDARRYLDLACAVLVPQPPRLVAIGGLSGTGKSTIAQALAPAMGARPGARVLRSDVVRKRLWSVMPEARLPADAYKSDVSQRVYEVIRAKAAVALRAGYSVIIDAVSLREDERAAFAAVATAAGVPFHGVWLEAPVATMTARLEERRGDASDAGPDVLRQQLDQDPGRIDWVHVDIGADGENGLAAVRRALNQRSRGAL